jgi:orotate phosphoribosyltransferase-like protein
MNTKIVITNEIIEQAQSLAAKGYNISMIASSLNIGNSTTRTNTTLRTAIKKGQDKARCDVVDKLMNRANESDTALIYLSKSLKVFEDGYTTAKPKSITEASNRIADIFKSVADNELDKDKADKLIRFLEAYIKSKEVGELEARITALEEETKK